MSHTINSASTVAVATDYFWQPIDTCPNGSEGAAARKGRCSCLRHMER